MQCFKIGIILTVFTEFQSIGRFSTMFRKYINFSRDSGREDGKHKREMEPEKYGKLKI